MSIISKAVIFSNFAKSVKKNVYLRVFTIKRHKMIATTLALARQRSPAFFPKNIVCPTSIVTKK